MRKVHLVWFKRDLRTYDHRPLFEAAKKGDVLPIYVFEHEYWALPDTSKRQWDFTLGSLQSLDTALTTLGQPLVIRMGQMIDELEALSEIYSIEAIYSHEETGNLWTYQRDLAVKEWCQRKTISWHEYKQFGVVRGRLDRDDWDKHWKKILVRSVFPPPEKLSKIVDGNLSILDQTASYFDEPEIQDPQRPGREGALECLHSFLYSRGQHYQKEMSSPNTAFTSCSRLSTYIAYGCLSITEILHALNGRRQKLYAMDHRPSGWLASLRSFESRLHWHCHFIQKLETEPSMETTSLIPALDQIRSNEFNEHFFRAWCEGQTGVPLIDACMRCVVATGYLNFRMRAMVVSFASYHLWLHWPHVAHFLARQFTDYEPGIHYSQFQMQSGVTGINAIRVYNPVKQAQDQDPNGTFIKRWVPELASLDPPDLFAPWDTPPMLLQLSHIELGKTYPHPVVDVAQAAKKAKERIYAARKTPEARAAAKQVFVTHGSRKSRR